MSNTVRLCENACPGCPIEVLRSPVMAADADVAIETVNAVATESGERIVSGEIPKDQIIDAVVRYEIARGESSAAPRAKTVAAARALEMISVRSCTSYGPVDLLQNS